MRFEPRGLLACLLALTLAPACTGDKGDDSTTGTEATEGEATETQPTEAQPTEAQPTEAMETEAQETEADSESASSGSTGAELDERCECAGSAACNQTLCATVEWLDEDADGELDAGVVDAFMTNATCALEALRDGQAGSISWRYVGDGGQYSEYGSHELFGDGSARETYGGSADLCSYVVDPIYVATLKPAQFFSDCLAETDTLARFGCVRDPNVEVTSICREGEENCDGV